MTADSIFKSVEYLSTPEGIEQSLRQKNDTSDLSFHVPPETGTMAQLEAQAEVTEMNDASRPPSGSSQPMIGRNITVSVSYLEIYNESVNDLLDANKRNLEVRDHQGEVIVENLTYKTVRSTRDIEQLLEVGEQVRIIAGTKSNMTSTRSHTVFRIHVEIDDRNV